MKIKEILQTSVASGASSLFIVPGSKVCIRVNGKVTPISNTVERTTASATEQMLLQIYGIAGRDYRELSTTGDDDFSFSLPDVGRFRCIAYKQRGSYAAVIHLVPFGQLSAQKLGIPDEVMDLALIKDGLVLVTGPSGSGKTTTLTCLVDKINKERNGHVITIEDSIESLHSHKSCLVSQRGVSQDTRSYAKALSTAMRQSPDVLMLGALQGSEIIQDVMSAAETGLLVLSSMYTVGAAKAIQRLVGSFPENMQAQVRLQLSIVLKAVVSQQLLPCIDGSMAPVFEVVRIDSDIQEMIQDGAMSRLNEAFRTDRNGRLVSMDHGILQLYKEGRISRETVMAYISSQAVLA